MDEEKAKSSQEETRKSATSRKTEAQESLSAALKTYATSMMRMAYCYTMNLPEAEEAVKNTLVKMVKEKPSFKSDERKQAWLLRETCAQARACIHSRSEGGAHQKELADELAGKLDGSVGENWDKAKKLSSHYREVAHLCAVEGMSTEQAASVLGRKETTVRSELKKAQEKISLDEYKQAMDQLKTDEAQQGRIARKAMKGLKPPMPLWKRVAAIVAAAIVVGLAVTLPVYYAGKIGQAEDSESSEIGNSYDSLVLLNSSTGLNMTEVGSLYTGARYITYKAYSGNAIGQIEYVFTGGQTIDYRKSYFTIDNVKDDTEYADVITVDVDGITVTMKGSGDGVYSLATWEDGTDYAYSLKVTTAVQQSDMTDMVTSAIESQIAGSATSSEEGSVSESSEAADSEAESSSDSE